MKKFIVFLFTLVLVLGTHGEPKSGTFDFTGHITSIRDTGGIIVGDVNEGDIVTGSLTYDLELRPNAYNYNSMYLISFELEYTLSNGIMFSAFDHPGHCSIFNDINGVDSLQHSYGYGYSNSERESAYMISDSYLWMEDSTGTVFSDHGLSSPLDPYSFDSYLLAIIAFDENSTGVPDCYKIIIDFSPVPVPVPEPATIILIGTGLFGFGLAGFKEKFTS